MKKKTYLDMSEELWTICENVEDIESVIPKEELSTFKKNNDITRTTATKVIWAYVKQEDLQDPNNKRNIICDDLLQDLSGKSKITMFEVAKVLSDNLFAKE